MGKTRGNFQVIVVSVLILMVMMVMMVMTIFVWMFVSQSSIFVRRATFLAKRFLVVSLVRVGWECWKGELFLFLDWR